MRNQNRKTDIFADGVTLEQQKAKCGKGYFVRMQAYQRLAEQKKEGGMTYDGQK
ncbi:MAG: hypothetical protein ACI4CZ_03760 [Hominisplanchenecus sp.]